MGKKKQEKRKKSKDVQPVKEEFSAELISSQKPENGEKNKDRKDSRKDNC